MSTFDFRGYKVWYRECGQGEPMLFLHNGGNDHRIWDHQVAHFAKTHRVFVLDHLGFGQSDCPEIEYTLPLYSEQVEAFIEYKGIVPVILVGHCIGGGMSLHYTLRHPENVKRLILFNVATEQTLLAGPLADVYRNFNTDRGSLRTFIEGMESTGLPREVTDQHLRNQFGAGSDPTVEFSDHIHRLWNQKGQMRALYCGIANFDTFRALDEFTKPPGFPPVCLFWGAENQILPAKGGEEVSRRLQPDRVEFLEGCGHMAMRDKPVEINNKIEAFLSRQ